MAGLFHKPKPVTFCDDERRIRIKGAAVGLIPVLIMALVLFGSSGDLFWLMVWIFICIHIGATIILSFCIDASLIAERLRPGIGIKKCDRSLVRLLTISGLLILFVAGLDHRFDWYHQITTMFQLTGIILFIIGYLLLIRSAIINSFFSTVVRIQSERNHQVISDGPYRFIRHPGYLGIILCLIAEPLMFQSLISGIPCLFSIGFMIMRIIHEEHTLSEELTGYYEYSRRVRFRLIPGIW